MGRKTKLGKQRKDKFYRLAKETGYRSRAAFKLVQLNRRFEFLQKSRVCIDLCAAPGGWMQVARQSMPVSSIVVGVDMFPIKPVSGCINLQEDITTDKCRIALQKTLQTWKADVVLNDGAPNVGKSWVFDAYQQACLTLSALKLATHFLRPGGWFVTKIFRSKDYNPLLWVFKQLFKKVHATKPQASRIESAEIFVVCQHYLAPDKLDARFLDPKHVFEELELGPTARLNVHHPEREKKPRAEGYADNDSLIYRMPVSEFLAAEDAVVALQKATEIVIDDEAIAANPCTTAEVKECCKDIRVLGRKDLKLLINWWKAIKEQRKEKIEEKTNLNGKSKEDETEDVEEESDEDAAIEKQLAQMEEENLKEARRQRKQANKLRKKLQTQMDLKMVLKGDSGPRLEEIDLFALTEVPGNEGLQKIAEQTPDVVAESDPDSDVEPEPRTMAYTKDGSTHLHSSGTHYTEEDSEPEEKPVDDDYDDDIPPKEGLGFDSDDSEDEKVLLKNDPKKVPSNPLITDLDHRNKVEKRIQKASLWFEKDVFKDVEMDEDVDLEIEEMEAKLGIKKDHKHIESKQPKSKLSKKVEEKNEEEEEEEEEKEVEKEGDDLERDLEWQINEYGSKKMKKGSISSLREEEEDDDGFEDDEKDSKKKKGKKNKETLNNPHKDGFEIVPQRKIKLDAESLAVGALMVTSKRMKRDIIDAGWNRYAFNDQDLPDWFIKDEKENMQKRIPVPPEMVKEYRKREEELNVRPIKKVVEAKARKKKHAIKRLEKAKKKVQAIMENVDISEKDKARQIRTLYKKAKGAKKPEVTYVVAKKHMAGKRMPRPLGVKGPYKVVDPRMKKDFRKRKLAEKKKGKGKGKGNSQAGGRQGRQKKPGVNKSMKEHGKRK